MSKDCDSFGRTLTCVAGTILGLPLTEGRSRDFLGSDEGEWLVSEGEGLVGCSGDGLRIRLLTDDTEFCREGGNALNWLFVCGAEPGFCLTFPEDIEGEGRPAVLGERVCDPGPDGSGGGSVTEITKQVSNKRELMIFSKPAWELSKRKDDVRPLLFRLRMRELVVEDALELARGRWDLNELPCGEILVGPPDSPPEAKVTDVFRARIVPVGPVGPRLSSSLSPSSHFRLERVATELVEILRGRRRPEATLKSSVAVREG